MAAVAFRQQTQVEPAADDTRDTLFLLGGLSLILFGAGLVITNPAVRKLMGQANVGGLLHSALPDLERYMRIRSM